MCRRRRAKPAATTADPALHNSKAKPPWPGRPRGFFSWNLPMLTVRQIKTYMLTNLARFPRSETTMLTKKIG